MHRVADSTLQHNLSIRTVVGAHHMSGLAFCCSTERDIDLALLSSLPTSKYFTEIDIG